MPRAAINFNDGIHAAFQIMFQNHTLSSPLLLAVYAHVPGGWVVTTWLHMLGSQASVRRFAHSFIIISFDDSTIVVLLFQAGAM